MVHCNRLWSVTAETQPAAQITASFQARQHYLICDVSMAFSSPCQSTLEESRWEMVKNALRKPILTCYQLKVSFKLVVLLEL